MELIRKNQLLKESLSYHDMHAIGIRMTSIHFFKTKLRVQNLKYEKTTNPFYETSLCSRHMASIFQNPFL